MVLTTCLYRMRSSSCDRVMTLSVCWSESSDCATRLEREVLEDDRVALGRAAADAGGTEALALMNQLVPAFRGER